MGGTNLGDYEYANLLVMLTHSLSYCITVSLTASLTHPPTYLTTLCETVISYHINQATGHYDTDGHYYQLYYYCD